MKLRTKIHLFTTLLMLILLVIMNSVVYLLYKEMAIDTEYKQLKTRSEELLTSFTQLNDYTDPYSILRSYMPTNGAIRVLDEQRNEITSVKASLDLNTSELKVNQNESYSQFEIDGIPLIIFETYAIWTDGNVVKLQLIQRLDDVANTLTLLKLVLIVVTILVTIPLLISNLVLSRIILKPVEKLSNIMKKSSNAGTYEKIEKVTKGKDELAEIGRTFNRMMDTLESNYRKQEQFVSNASHELKTPLTVIESYAKLLLRRGFTNEKIAKEALEAIVNQSSHMNDLIVQMLDVAKNKEQTSLLIERINLSHLLENTLIQMRQAYHRKFVMKDYPTIFIYTDEQKLKQLLFIILDNARKYSEQEIVINVTENTNTVSISIKDFGEGISEDQLPHLFDRFYRVKQDRNRKTGGTGLGLAIAKELSDRLQINIEVESKLNVGTCFTLLIPKEIALQKEGK